MLYVVYSHVMSYARYDIIEVVAGNFKRLIVRVVDVMRYQESAL